MAVKTYLEAIRDGIREEMQRDDRVMILGEDVGGKGGVFGVSEGLQKELLVANVFGYANYTASIFEFLFGNRVDRDAQHIRRQHVAGELYTLKAAIEGSR